MYIKCKGLYNEKSIESIRYIYIQYTHCPPPREWLDHLPQQAIGSSSQSAMEVSWEDAVGEVSEVETLGKKGVELNISWDKNEADHVATKNQSKQQQQVAINQRQQMQRQQLNGLKPPSGQSSSSYGIFSPSFLQQKKWVATIWGEGVGIPWITWPWLMFKYLQWIFPWPILNWVVAIPKLGGGLKYFSMYTPTWGNDPIWRAYFSNGLKPTN